MVQIAHRQLAYQSVATTRARSSRPMRLRDTLSGVIATAAPTLHKSKQPLEVSFAATLAATARCFRS